MDLPIKSLFFAKRMLVFRSANPYYPLKSSILFATFIQIEETEMSGKFNLDLWTKIYKNVRWSKLIPALEPPLVKGLKMFKKVVAMTDFFAENMQ